MQSLGPFATHRYRVFLLDQRSGNELLKVNSGQMRIQRPQDNDNAATNLWFNF